MQCYKFFVENGNFDQVESYILYNVQTIYFNFAGKKNVVRSYDCA